jgi:hypothetical protein
MPVDPISNADRVVMLLRARLRERSGVQGRKPETILGGVAPRGIEALAKVQDVDDRQLRRAFVQNILTGQFGTAALNSAKFQQLVGRVTDALEADSETSALLSQSIEELKASQ